MEIMVSKLLLEHSCVQLSPSSPFTYASGLQGPIYCDNRKLLAHPDARGKVIQAFQELISIHDITFDKIAGLATAGIPHAAILAHELAEPMLYIRSKPKAHGKGNQIEGDFQKGDKVLLIEDLVNQASSLEAAYDAACVAGLEPIACLSIVDYGMKRAKERLRKMNLPLYSLTDFTALSTTALEAKLITSDEYALLMAWQENPEAWSHRAG